MKRFRKYPEKWIFTSRAYGENVQAMTAENLHSKMDIAAELAWRDERIAELIAVAMEEGAGPKMREVLDKIMVGE